MKMLSTIELKYKKTLGCLENYWTWINQTDSRFILAFFVFLSLVIISNTIQTFRSAVSLFLIFSVLLTYRTKTVSLSFFLVSLFSLQFFNPNKYWTIEIIRHQDFFRGLKLEYLLGFGINLANIMLCFSLFLVIRKIEPKILLYKNAIYSLLIPGILFFLIGLYSSLYYSPFPEASFIWLLQYSQIYIVGILFLIFFLHNKKTIEYLFSVVGSICLFQFAVSTIQFIKQSSLNLNFEYNQNSSFSLGLDENNAFLRPNGTFLFHNQLAYVLTLCLSLLLPYAFHYKKFYYFLICVLTSISIVLTQSRSAWISTSIIILLILVHYKEQAKNWIRMIGIKRVIVYLLLSAISLAFIIIPRFLLSFNVAYEGAGLPVRIKMAKEALVALSDNPWIGYGVGTNEVVLYRLFPRGIMSTFTAAVHQAYIQLLLEVGVLGGIFFILPFILIAKKLLIYTIAYHEITPFSFGFFMSTIASLIYYSFQPHVGIVEFPFLGLTLGIGLIGVYLEDAKHEKGR